MTNQFKNSGQASAVPPIAFLASDMADLANCLFRFLNQYRNQLSSSNYQELLHYWKNLRSHANFIEYRRPEVHMLQEFCDAEELLASLQARVTDSDDNIGASQ